MKNLNLVIHSFCLLLLFTNCKKNNSYVVSEKQIFGIIDEFEEIIDSEYKNEHLYLITRNTSTLESKLYKLNTTSGEITWQWQGVGDPSSPTFTMLFSETHVTLRFSETNNLFINLNTGNIDADMTIAGSNPIWVNNHIYFTVSNSYRKHKLIRLDPFLNEHDSVSIPPCDGIRTELQEIFKINGVQHIGILRHCDDYRKNSRSSNLYIKPLNASVFGNPVSSNFSDHFISEKKNISRVENEGLTIAFSNGIVQNVRSENGLYKSSESDFKPAHFESFEVFDFQLNNNHFFVQSGNLIRFKPKNSGAFEKFYEEIGVKQFSVSDQYVTINKLDDLHIIDASNGNAITNFNANFTILNQFSVNNKIR